MKLNKDQKDALAKIADNIATGLILASIIGWWVEGKLPSSVVTGLTGVSALSIFLGLVLRKGSVS